MSAYLIFSFDIADKEQFAPYAQAVMPILLKHQAEILAVDPGAQELEGVQREVNVIISFPTEEGALAFYHDPEYAPWKRLRMRSTSNSTAVLVKELAHSV